MRRKLILPLLLLCTATGCGDSLDTICARAAIAKNEIIDLVLKVNDEDQAKLTREKLIPKAIEQFEEVTKDRLDKWEKNFGANKQINDFCFQYKTINEVPLDLTKKNQAAIDKIMQAKVKKDNERPSWTCSIRSRIMPLRRVAATNRIDFAANRLEQIIAKLTAEKLEEIAQRRAIRIPKCDRQSTGLILSTLKPKISRRSARCSLQ